MQHNDQQPLNSTKQALRRRLIVGIVVLLSVVGQFVYGNDEDRADKNSKKLLVLKQGDNVYIRSHYSDTQDLLRVMSKGRNNQQINFGYTGLLPAAVNMAMTAERGTAIHYCGDDAAPWLLNGTYIGGNHGCFDVLELTSANHGLALDDIGSAWEDAASNVFHLIKIVAPDKLMFLSKNIGKSPVWKFITKISGNVLADKTRGKQLVFSKYERAQLWPACRINKQEYLVDGTAPLKDNEVIGCAYLDIIDDYDIIDPASQLAAIIKHPGQEPNLTADGLEGVVQNNILYRFFPDGQNVVFYKAKALKGFNLNYMGFFQTSPLRLEDKQPHIHEYYIPKTLPYKLKGMVFDFKTVQDVTALPDKVILSCNRQNVENSENLPERFIQFISDKKDGETQRKVGYAVGYSLITGVTVPAERARNNNLAGFFGQTSKKTGASAISGKMGFIPKDMEFYCIVYRIYFNPEKYRNPTCVYWYREGDNTVVYVDYHKSVDKDIIQLPSALIGKRISVIEKTPSLTLHACDTVPAGGVELSVKDYGYIVFKVH